MKHDLGLNVKMGKTAYLSEQFRSKSLILVNDSVACKESVNCTERPEKKSAKCVVRGWGQEGYLNHSWLAQIYKIQYKGKSNSRVSTDNKCEVEVKFVGKR